MDKIIIKGLTVFAYHGVNPEEKISGQNFILDIIAYKSLAQPGFSDNINDTVSYSKILKTATKVMTKNKYNLLEKVAQKIIEQLFKEFESINKIDICLKKPNAPISANFEYVGIEISRTRENFV